MPATGNAVLGPGYSFLDWGNRRWKNKKKQPTTPKKTPQQQKPPQPLKPKGTIK